MYEWTLGITDSDPTAWRSHEPHWEDEKIVAGSGHSFHDVMDKLCETTIKKRREYDHGIDDHLWIMRINSAEDAMNPFAAEARMMRALERDDSRDDDGRDDSNDEDEKKYRRNVVIQFPNDENNGGYEDFDDPDSQVLSAHTKLSRSILPPGHVVKVTYDYGSTTTIYLKVLSVKARAVQSLLQYFSLEARSSAMLKELDAVPAYRLPKEEQVDFFLPNASKALLGYYVPIFSGGDGYDIGVNRKVMGCVTMGLSGKLRSEKDLVFCSMEDRTQSRDLLFCPCLMEPTELLETIDKAWEPRDRSADENGLEQFRYDCINRWLVAADNDEVYEEISEMLKSDSGFGSKKLLFRLPRDRKNCGFRFERAFPRTHAMLTCGKFRWFQYNKDVLRVVVGRGVGADSRQCGPEQILRTWDHKFVSLHELLCAVEASWVWKGKELAADAVLPEFDIDLGPSKPLPREPPCYGKEEDAIVISRCSDKKKLVTALAIAEEMGGKTVLYSGHDDGTLTKWSLDNNDEIWSKRIYSDGTKDFERYNGIGICVRETPGVAGIVIRPDPISRSKKSIIYTWSDAYAGYPQREFKDRGPARLKAWSGVDGKYLRSYKCDVGNDREGNKACPSISTVVFCKVFHEDYSPELLDTIVVGLHCCCNALEYDETFSDFELGEARDFSEGNIVPFLENSNGEAMPSWRGQGGMIRAMAVVKAKYLVSFSIRMGHGLPDSMVLWSLEEGGIPIFQKWFWDTRQRNVFKQSLTRLQGIDGISVEGKNILLTDNHGDRIVAVTVEEDETESPFVKCSLKLHGFASIGSKHYEDEGFHGRMASSKSTYGAVAMEIEPTAWIFHVGECTAHSNLDRRDGNRRQFNDDGVMRGEDEDHLKEKRAAREMATCKIQFPLWGGNKPTRKKKKLEYLEVTYDDDSDGLGKGGPVQLAMRGRQVVAGFTNGSLTKVVLPEQFEDCTWSISSNHLASCGTLPSDEWHVPVLQCEGDDSDDDSEDDEDEMGYY